MAKVRIKKKPANDRVPQNDVLGEQVMDDGGLIFHPSDIDFPYLVKKGGWLKGAVNPAHKGYCTPMTKSTCTPRRKAFAMTMKKHHGFHKKDDGGFIMHDGDAEFPFLMDDGGLIFHPSDIEFPYLRKEGGPVEMKGGGNWIQGAIKHPGRCSNPGDARCPKGSPQYNLAMTFKKHHGFHKKKKDDGGLIFHPSDIEFPYLREQGGSLTYPFQQEQGYMNSPNMDMGGILKRNFHFPDMDGNMYDEGGSLAAEFDRYYKQNYKKGGKKINTQNLIGNITNPDYMRSGGKVFAGVPNPDLNPTTNHSIADYNPYIYFKDKKWYITSNPEDEEITSSMKPIDKDSANIEAEKGEYLVKPGMTGLYKVTGKTHAEGGTPLYAQGGSFIFSNDPTLAITKKEKEAFNFKNGGSNAMSKNTPAKVLEREMSSKDYNNYISIIQDPDRDKIAKTSAMLMLEKLQQKLGQVAYLQETKKDKPVPDFAQGSAPVMRPEFEDIDERMSEYAYGGRYPDGGPAGYGMGPMGGGNPGFFGAADLGLFPPDRNGKWIGDNRMSKNPQTGAPSNSWNAMTDFGSAREYAAAVGYPGKDLSPLSIQRWVGMTYPDIVSQYHNNPPGGYGLPAAGTPYDGKLGVRWNNIGKAVRDLNNSPLKSSRLPSLAPVEQDQAQVTAPPPIGSPNQGTVGQGNQTLPYDIKGKLTDAQLAHLGYLGLQSFNINKYYPKREQVTLPDVRLDQVNAQPYLNQINNQAYGANQLAALNPRTAPLMASNIRGATLDASSQAIGNVANQNVQIGNQQNLTNLQQRTNQVMTNSQLDNNYYNQVQTVNENFDRERRFANNQFYSTLNQYKSDDDQLAWALASTYKYGVRKVTDPKTGIVYNQPTPLFEMTGRGMRFNADVANPMMATNANRINTPAEISNMYQQFKSAGMEDNVIRSIIGSMIRSRGTATVGQGPMYTQNPWGPY